MFCYFGLWIFLALTTLVLNILNINWSTTNIVQGVFIVVVLGIIQGSVMEFPVQTFTTLVMGGNIRKDKKACADNLTIILNYNLLATGRDDIDECMETMYDAYIDNLSMNVSAVLVSATNDEKLKEYELEVRDKYRALIYDVLFQEGVSYSDRNFDRVDSLRLEHVWSQYDHIDGLVFARDHLNEICDGFAREFMVIHRVSRVVRKCGQYQDLMLLSNGDDEAYSYTDKEYYGTAARTYGEPLFHDSEDVENIFGRKFHYTLVLDADTGVPKKAVFDLLEIAAAHPDKGIIQPSIKLTCDKDDTMFMHLESMRQSIYEPMTNALTAMLGQSGYFGKAMLKNSVYIENVIGPRDFVIERVPINVLSHDTFEAALLRPYYAATVHLLEAPSYNYVTWNIRERRWNRGEIILATYFWKYAIGAPMAWLQKKFQGDKFNPVKLRTESELDIVSSYIAHSALRQMLMKPLLLSFILLHISVDLHHTYVPVVMVMFLVLVFPKFATCNKKNYKYVFIETLASIFQFTPEAMVGSVRICRALQVNISAKCKWIPQRAVEEDFKNSNPFVSSLKHLWGYSAFALVAAIIVMIFSNSGQLLLVMLATVIVLPFYTGFTSLTLAFKSSRNIRMFRDNVEMSTTSLPTISSSLPSIEPSQFSFQNEIHPSVKSKAGDIMFRTHEPQNVSFMNPV